MSQITFIQVGDKIDATSEISMSLLMKTRLEGNWIVFNQKRTIVKFVGGEQDAKDFFTTHQAKRGGAFLLEPLRAIKITVKEQENYHQIQKSITQEKLC